ncbi:MAG: hypothetical protein MJZ27_12070, partial [Bacteroidales bacterium]|nr:hypothetical protein [Bacteroidales bacterium]
MKKLFTLFVMALCAIVAFAQKEAIGYTCIIKDNDGNPMAKQNVKIKIQMLPSNYSGNGIADEYTEVHNVRTDENGMAQIEIGNGTVESTVKKTLSDFDFSEGTIFYVAIDTDGTGYSIDGGMQLTSVPYAFYAENAAKAAIADKAT